MTRTTSRIRRAMALASAAACLATVAAPAVASPAPTGPPRPTFTIAGKTYTVTERAYRYCLNSTDVVISRMRHTCMIIETIRDLDNGLS